MPQSGDLQEAYIYCDRIARQRARNFYPAFRFLSRQRRLALSAFYVFCSYSDDIADDESGLSLADKQQKLKEWTSQLEGSFAGKAEAPLFVALGDAITRYELPHQPFYDLLKGIEMDFTSRRYPTFEDLEVYCRYVASSVGLVSVRIFGCNSPDADRYADALGIGLQLTNIMRDLVEDFKRGRIYIPLEDLDRFSYSEKDLHSHVFNDNFVHLMDFQYKRALEYFSLADPELANDQCKKLLPAEIMKYVYRQILEEMRRRDFRVFDGRIAVPRWRAITSIANTLLKYIIR